METLIVGYGSIGKRHARLLAPLVGSIRVVTAQAGVPFATHTNLSAALEQAMPDYVVLCSSTHLHGAQLSALKQAGFTGKVLVEKPLVAHAGEAETAYPFQVFVAYNLRFHAVIQALRELLATETSLSVQAYVGQHLAQWRPDRTAKETYSAHAAQGGGVLRDLSHELDLLAHLFGPLELHAAMVNRVGEVTVDSEDAAALLLHAPTCRMIGLMMNYLDHVPSRTLRIVTREHSIYADLIRGEISMDGEMTQIRFTADDSYRVMHEAVLGGATEHLCTLQEGLRTVQLIAQAQA